MAAEAKVGFDPWQQIHFGRDVLTWMQHMTGAQRPHTHATKPTAQTASVLVSSSVVVLPMMLQMLWRLASCERTQVGWSITRLSIEVW